MSVLIGREKISNAISKKINHLKLINDTISPQRYFLVSFCRSRNRHRSASLTVEAALIVPIFLFFFYLLWQYFLFLLLQLSVCQDVASIVFKSAGLGYIERKVAKESAEQLSWAYLPLFQATLEKNERAEEQKVLCIVNQEGEICVQVHYNFLCEAPFLPAIKIPVTQSFCFYPYLGIYDSDCFLEEEEKRDVVYVTKSGSVYHESVACTYLNFAVRSVSAGDITKERNSSGRKYTECERCRGEPHTAIVYMTNSGLRYHWSLQCPAISRDVYEKERSEVEGMRACSRCGQ